MPTKGIPTNILNEAGSRYGVYELKLLSMSESGTMIYEYQIGDNEFILKLIPHSNKDREFVKNLIESELDWINYLADNEIKTPRAIISKHNNYVELIDINSKSFLSVVSFEKDTGRQIMQSDFDAELFVKIGRLTGKIHKLAKQYYPKKNAHKRPEWYEDEYLDIERLIPVTDSVLVEKSRELINDLKKLPRQPDSYGLIHGDLQEHNLHINKGDITILDFESCIYCWYIVDFVASLEAVIGSMPFGKAMDDATIYFSENYWKGYIEENLIEPLYFQKVPEIFRLWELFLYNQFINEWDMANLSEKRKRLLSNYRFDILNGNRFKNINFESFCID